MLNIPLIAFIKHNTASINPSFLEINLRGLNILNILKDFTDEKPPEPIIEMKLVTIITKSITFQALRKYDYPLLNMKPKAIIFKIHSIPKLIENPKSI